MCVWVCSGRWIIDLWQVMRAHINEGDLSLPLPSISPLPLPLHSHSRSPFCCHFPWRRTFSQSQTHVGELLRVSLSRITSTDGKRKCWNAERTIKNSWFYSKCTTSGKVHHKTTLPVSPPPRKTPGPSAALPETVYGPFLHERSDVGCWW